MTYWLTGFDYGVIAFYSVGFGVLDPALDTCGFFLSLEHYGQEHKNVGN